MTSAKSFRQLIKIDKPFVETYDPDLVQEHCLPQLQEWKHSLKPWENIAENKVV